MSDTNDTGAAKAGILRKLCCVSRMSSHYPSAFWVCICFIILNIWVKEVGSSPLFVPENLNQETLVALSNTKYFFYSGTIVSSLFFAILGKVFDVFLKEKFFALSLSLGIVMCLSTFSFLTVFSQPLIDPILLSNAACFISAVCYNFFLLILVSKLAENDGLRTSIICLTVASVLEMILGSLLKVAFTKTALLVATALLPLVCGIVLTLIIGKIPKREKSERLLVGRERFYHIALIYVMSFGTVAVISAELNGPKLILFGTRGDWLTSSAFNFVVLIGSVLVLILFAWLFLIRRADDPISTRFQPSLLIVIMGCLLLVMNNFIENHLMLSLEIIVATLISPFAWLLSWSIAVSAINSTSASPSRLLGFRGLLFNALVVLKIVLLEGNSIVVNSLILVSIFVIVCALTVFSAKFNQPAKVDEEELWQKISLKYKLSAREVEVFALLAQGRNGPNIEKQLNIARGTVKTHANRIYSKMGIHSHQELIDLVAKEKKGSVEGRFLETV